jgi:hypothetical protein
MYSSYQPIWSLLISSTYGTSKHSKLHAIQQVTGCKLEFSRPWGPTSSTMSYSVCSQDVNIKKYLYTVFCFAKYTLVIRIIFFISSLFWSIYHWKTPHICWTHCEELEILDERSLDRRLSWVFDSWSLCHLLLSLWLHVCYFGYVVLKSLHKWG